MAPRHSEGRRQATGGATAEESQRDSSNSRAGGAETPRRRRRCRPTVELSGSRVVLRATGSKRGPKLIVKASTSLMPQNIIKE